MSLQKQIEELLPEEKISILATKEPLGEFALKEAQGHPLLRTIDGKIAYNLALADCKSKVPAILQMIKKTLLDYSDEKESIDIRDLIELFNEN